MATEHVDVLIVGAGLSGVAAAYYVQTRCPTKTYAILEGRDAIGGTWDLFRYPGVRSDSDMYTLGYTFRPWQDAKAIADGPAILHYVRDTAATFVIDQHIRYHHAVRRAAWSSAEGVWTVEAERGPDLDPIQLTCNFLCMCTGYYAYDRGFMPEWPGVADFTGRIVHPQQWPDDLAYAGKRVVVIGSGATAVTLVPAMAETAAHVTMVQRSPTYIVARPSEDALANWLRRILPARFAHQLARAKNIALGMYFYDLTRRRPKQVKETIIKMARAELGPEYDVEKDFAPTYNPWDQRLCLAPDADFFKAITLGRASIVTEQIETFTATGLRLRSGDEVPADIIITATGLNMRLLNGMHLSVDGAPVDLAQTLSYRGMMYSGVPNLASVFGYTNASWTLKCELIVQYVCRLLNYMDRHGYSECRPEPANIAASAAPMLPLTSGYVRRALDSLPRQGLQKPWRTYQNYVRDVFSLRLSRLNDGTMHFARGGKSL
jgi:monooxygenase